MGLKDIAKIVANQTALERHNESEQKPLKPALQESLARLDDKASKVKPGTNKPVDVAGHHGFKYDSSNPFHKDMINTLLNNGQMDKITVHEGGVVSFPKETVYQNATRFQVAADTAGGEKKFKGEAAKVTPRKSENTAKPVSRPAARTVPPARPPRRTATKKTAETNPLIEDRAEVMRNLFGK